MKIWFWFFLLWISNLSISITVVWLGNKRKSMLMMIHTKHWLYWNQWPVNHQRFFLFWLNLFIDVEIMMSFAFIHKKKIKFYGFFLLYQIKCDDVVGRWWWWYSIMLCWWYTNANENWPKQKQNLITIIYSWIIYLIVLITDTLKIFSVFYYQKH